MELKDKIYFTTLREYKPKYTKKIIYPEILTEINYLSEKLKNTAKDALCELISPKIARKEISDILDNIKDLKKEGRKNVRKP